MQCPNCGAAQLIRDTRDLPCIHKGERGTIAAVTGDFCPACGEVLLGREQGDRYSALLGQFQRRVNAAGAGAGAAMGVRGPSRFAR